MDKVITQNKIEKFVNAILKEKNIKASKYLEKILKHKCENRIKNTLNQ